VNAIDCSAAVPKKREVAGDGCGHDFRAGEGLSKSNRYSIRGMFASLCSDEVIVNLQGTLHLSFLGSRY
jgi:hypothetical protein